MTAAVGVALRDAVVDAILIVPTVAGERGQRARHLVEQGAGLGAVVHLAAGQRRGHDPARVGVHAEMELSPRPARARAVLLGQPLARATQLEPRAVHEKMQGLGVAATAGVRPRLWHLQRRGPATEGRMVRHAQRQPEQADDGADQPLGLAVGQAEHGPERECRQDGERRVPGLPAPGRAWFSRPRFDRLVGEPDRQAAALPQAGVIRRPVRDLVRLSRDVTAAVLVQLEGQGGHPGSAREHSPTTPGAPSPTSRPIRAPRFLPPQSIRQRVKEGIVAARARGRKGGRPRIMTIDKLRYAEYDLADRSRTFRPSAENSVISRAAPSTTTCMPMDRSRNRATAPRQVMAYVAFRTFMQKDPTMLPPILGSRCRTGLGAHRPAFLVARPWACGYSVRRWHAQKWNGEVGEVRQALAGNPLRRSTAPHPAPDGPWR